MLELCLLSLLYYTAPILSTLQLHFYLSILCILLISVLVQLPALRHSFRYLKKLVAIWTTTANLTSSLQSLSVFLSFFLSLSLSLPLSH